MQNFAKGYVMKNTNWDTIITKHINKIIVKCLKDELYNKQKLLICLNLTQQYIQKIKEKTNQKTPTPDIEPIGKIAQKELKNLLTQRQWSEQEFYNFFDGHYSKVTFDINYPLLAYDKFDERQYSRYYKDPQLVNGINCYFCSQWYEHSNSRQKVAEFVSKYQGVTQ